MHIQPYISLCIPTIRSDLGEEGRGVQGGLIEISPPVIKKQSLSAAKYNFLYIFPYYSLYVSPLMGAPSAEPCIGPVGPSWNLAPEASLALGELQEFDLLLSRLGTSGSSAVVTMQVLLEGKWTWPLPLLPTPPSPIHGHRDEYAYKSILYNCLIHSISFLILSISF